ncbi:hypothetical protein pb186bvf_020593 [Paramecium bursaria]
MQEDQITFDSILSKQIKFGKSQIITFSIVSLIDFLDGSELMYLMLLNSILYTEWSLNQPQLIILGSVFNIGLVIGAILCGYSSDIYGRKRILIFGCFLQALTVFATAFARNYIEMLILRTLYGIVIGLSIPISQILMTEVTPQRNRGQVIVSLQVMYVFGRLWTLFLAWQFLESLNKGNWRGMALCNTIPCTICFFASILFLQESPRHHIVQGNFQEGIEGMNHMGRLNNDNFEEIQQTQIDKLQDWQEATFKQQLLDLRTMDLFNEENLPITWRVYLISISTMIVFSGIYLLIPFILSDENKTFLDLFYTVIVEIPAIVIVYYYIDDFGRKPIVLIGSVISSLCLFVIWYWEKTYLILGLTAFKFFARVTFLAFNPLVVESYSTIYRSLALGTAQGFSRIAGVFAPALIFTIYAYDKYVMFLIGAFINLMIFGVMISFPKDLTRKPLDMKKQE